MKYAVKAFVVSQRIGNMIFEDIFHNEMDARRFYKLSKADTIDHETKLKILFKVKLKEE